MVRTPRYLKIGDAVAVRGWERFGTQGFINGTPKDWWCVSRHYGVSINGTSCIVAFKDVTATKRNNLCGRCLPKVVKMLRGNK